MVPKIFYEFCIETRLKEPIKGVLDNESCKVFDI